MVYGMSLVIDVIYDIWFPKQLVNWRASRRKMVLGIVIVIGDLLKYLAKNDLYISNKMWCLIQNRQSK